MKQINIIGMGMSAKTVTGEALELIQDADILIGAKRLLEMLDFIVALKSWFVHCLNMIRF